MKSIIDIATQEIGVKEKSGAKNNPRILQYAEDTRFKKYTNDEGDWCSLFVNWCAHQAGLERSFSLGARSWLTVGETVETPKPGDIVIFWRGAKVGDWRGHVGIFKHYLRNGDINCLGGNQGHEVNIKGQDVNKLLGFRRLRSAEDFHFPRKVLKRKSKKERVELLQDALKLLGYELGTSDGDFGEKTEIALKAFQADNEGLEINGIFDKATRECMEGYVSGIADIKSFLKEAI